MCVDKLQAAEQSRIEELQLKLRLLQSGVHPTEGVTANEADVAEERLRKGAGISGVPILFLSLDDGYSAMFRKKLSFLLLLLLCFVFFGFSSSG